MYLPDHIRTGNIQNIIVSLQRHGMIPEEGSPVGILIQTLLLYHGPHCPVKNKDLPCNDIFR